MKKLKQLVALALISALSLSPSTLCLPPTRRKTPMSTRLEIGTSTKAIGI